jgi:hypothetical protein
MKRIGWKVLTGPTSTYIAGRGGDPLMAIDLRVQSYLKEGWILKGQMTRVHSSSTLWTQIIELYIQ